jgi:hypothetical protein
MLSSCGGDGDQGTDPPEPPDTAVATVEVTPGIDTAYVGNVVQLNARARNAAGTQVSATFAWSSSDPARATVSTGGLVTSLQTGIIWIRATSGTVTDSAQLYLAPVVTITHRLPSLFAGDTTRLSVTFRRVLGGAIPIVDSVWSSSDPAIATIAPDGIISGHMAGSALIRVTSSGGADSQTVVVLPNAARPNREIAFLRSVMLPDSSGDPPALFVANPDGSGEVQVTPVGSELVQYTWTPDGSQLLAWYFIITNGLGNSFFSLITPDGSSVQPFPMQVRGANFSPDGARLAYHAGEGSNVVIMVANVDGSNPQPLTDAGGQNEVNPVWSPDSRQIAYRSEPCSILYVMDANGSNERPLVTGGACSYRWSPDGKEIGYTKGNGVWAVNVETGISRPLSPNCTETSCGTPTHSSISWRWDAARIAMASSEGTGQVSLVDRDGGNVLSVDPGPANLGSQTATNPAWSPSGTRIALVANANDSIHPTLTRIRTMNADGSAPLDGPLGAGVQWRP